MKVPLKQAFRKHLQHRYSLRLHMFVILLATTLSGILFSKALLLINVFDFRVRYTLVVVCSYLVFFLCIKLWLHWIASVKGSGASATDWFDFPVSSSGGGTDTVFPPIYGGGGQFSGAGASGFFDNPDTATIETTVFSDSSDAGGGASEGISDTLGEAAGALGDDDGILSIIALVILVATILVSAVFFIYSAPVILAEAAFEGVLAASLVKRTRTISDKAWVGGVFKATWKPFAVVLGVAFLSGLVIHVCFPHAMRLADILGRG